MDPVVTEHVTSSQTGNEIHVPCIGRQNPFHWATTEVLENFYIKASRSKSHHILTSVFSLLREQTWKVWTLNIYFQVWTKERENYLTAVNLSLVKTHTHTHTHTKKKTWKTNYVLFVSSVLWGLKVCQDFSLKYYGLWL